MFKFIFIFCGKSSLNGLQFNTVTMAGINWKREPFLPDSRLWLREPRKRQLPPPSQTRSHCIKQLSPSQCPVKDCPLYRLDSYHKSDRQQSSQHRRFQEHKGSK